jgi:transcription initiation factor IIE alpha subunit
MFEGNSSFRASESPLVVSMGTCMHEHIQAQINNNNILRRFIYLLYNYAVAVCRHTRKGHQISLWMVVSHYVVAGI